MCLLLSSTGGYIYNAHLVLVLICQGVLETVARRVTKKNETKDNKYVPNLHLSLLFSLVMS
jgi:hypothetical protein